MVDISSKRPTLRRCFVTGAAGRGAEALADLLTERGIDVIDGWALSAGSAVTPEILRMIAEADFVAAALGPADQAGIMFELGVARALAKPAFIVLAGGRLPFDLNGVFVRAVEGFSRISDAGPDLDLFLRNAKPPPPIRTEPRGTPGVALDWALVELQRFRSGSVSQRGAVFEDLVGKVFEAAGAQVSPNDAEIRDIDYVVWLDEVSHETGGPILVECKVLGGGSGSVIANAKTYVKRLAKTLSSTNATLALLIYDHDRPHVPQGLYDTPQVITIAIDDLIAGLQSGTFGSDVLRRRQRAAIARAAD